MTGDESLPAELRQRFQAALNSAIARGRAPGDETALESIWPAFDECDALVKNSKWFVTFVPFVDVTGAFARLSMRGVHAPYEYDH